MSSDTKITFPCDEDFLDYIRSFVDECRLSAGAVDRLFALARRGTETQWRPIETAPKDGTPLLLLWPDAAEKMAVMWWDEYVENWLGYYDGINPGYQPPTHWMPLPPPPQENPDGEP